MGRKKVSDGGKWWQRVDKEKFRFRVLYGPNFFDAEEYEFENVTEYKKAIALHKIKDEDDLRLLKYYAKLKK